VLVTDNCGTARPALYYFVTVTKPGVKVTSFGTCGDFIRVKQLAIPFQFHLSRKDRNSVGIESANKGFYPRVQHNIQLDWFAGQ
jgi:hypothetical protein